jgi:hypothetical protein
MMVDDENATMMLVDGLLGVMLTARLDIRRGKKVGGRVW